MANFMQKHEVTYYLTRTVVITVDVPRGEDPYEYSNDLLDLNDGEIVADHGCCEVENDPD